MFIKKKEFNEIKKSISTIAAIIQESNELQNVHHQQINALVFEKKELKDKLKDISTELKEEIKEYKVKIQKFKEEKKEQKKIIDNLNKEIIRLKSKPKTTPTIEELEKDKLFHGKKKGSK